MKKKVIRLNEQDIENLVRKIIKESDFDWAKEDSYEPDLEYAQDTKYFKVGDKKKYNGRPVTIISVSGNFIKAKYDDNGNIFELPIGLGDDWYTKGIGESDFSWDEVLANQNQGRNPNKWNSLERELSSCIEPLIEKYAIDFGNDSYAVIDAIYQIMDGMFQKR
jgi:hypothetical protein